VPVIPLFFSDLRLLPGSRKDPGKSSLTRPGRRARRVYSDPSLISSWMRAP
jgi:hypothetical protein